MSDGPLVASASADLDGCAEPHQPRAVGKDCGQPSTKCQERFMVQALKHLVRAGPLDPKPLITAGDARAELSTRFGVLRPVVPALGENSFRPENGRAGLASLGRRRLLRLGDPLADQAHVFLSGQVGKCRWRLK